MERLEGISLADLAQRLALQDTSFRNFHAKVYSYIPPSADLVLAVLREFELRRESFPNHHPATILIGDISNVVRHQSQLVPARNQNGEHLNIHIRIDQLELPKCEYFCLVSPFHQSEGNSNYERAFESIKFLRSLVSLHFGKLCSYSYVGNFDFDLEGKLSLHSPVFRRPMHADFFKIRDSGIGKTILERLALQMADFRLRFQRACNMFNGALDQQDEAFRFASYWIALEILVGSTDDAIRATLADAYRYPNKKGVDDKLLFDQIARSRHNLIHRGVFESLPAYHERLLQLYFWDLALHQLNLPHRGLARLLVTSGLIEEELQTFPMPIK
jgi:hypothetical protein